MPSNGFVFPRLYTTSHGEVTSNFIPRVDNILSCPTSSSIARFLSRRQQSSHLHVSRKGKSGFLSGPNVQIMLQNWDYARLTYTQRSYTKFLRDTQGDILVRRPAWADHIPPSPVQRFFCLRFQFYNIVSLVAPGERGSSEPARVA